MLSRISLVVWLKQILQHCFLQSKYNSKTVKNTMGVTTFFAVLIEYENLSCLLIFIVVLLFVYICTRKPDGIPPGPSYTFPMVGDFPLLIGGDILGTFRKLRKKHGDIFSLYFGKDLTIVINSYKLLHEAAVRKGDVFSGRPSFFANDLCGGKRGITLTDGPFWKNQRKFTHASLQEFGFGKSTFEGRILQEVECFIDVLMEQDGRPFDFGKYIHASVANVIYSIVCGKRHEYDDEQLQKLLLDLEIMITQGQKVRVLLSCAPFLEYVPGDPLGMNMLRNIMKDWKEYSRNIHEEHARKLDENKPKDFFDMYILEMSKGDNPEFTVDQLCTIARDLFAAGSETTATTIRWAVLYLLKYGDIKARLQSDIDEIIPDNHFPRLEDKANLPYVEAFILEVLRYANIAPLGVPHAVTTDDVVFQGYRIPKDTPVLFNLDSVLKDPQLFENPLQFNPGRFIGDDGKVFRPKEFIPFGIGRRICLGKAVAKMELFLFLAAMIKQFDFVLPEGVSEPDLEGVLSDTYAPKPFKVRAIQRFSKK